MKRSQRATPAGGLAHLEYASEKTGVAGCVAAVAGALVHHTTLHECDFTGASLSLAQRCYSDFSTGQLKETQLQKTLFVNGEFNEASFENLLFYKTWISRCRFHRARLDSGFFMERTLPELYFSQATLHKITFLKSTLKNAVFTHPSRVSSFWVETQAEQARFANATLMFCSGAPLMNINFIYSRHRPQTPSTDVARPLKSPKSVNSPARDLLPLIIVR
ncbi:MULTISPECIES: pentapeptide repeat-containing protein [Tenebrionibacter/Tenebrionicola group]|uniref:Pentapeptide repeat-containing protein n=2 Tax=Tenebrionibacter/Tenebrionicola group TaxID=2969848 RepID=A0A8K0V386_9ENTR|nr:MULTISPECIES: hypothetical protein [Tenebrionibacter/Tenebrionicola group]MBK4716021.1 pentapeptide repeat-containing protein [Tenebrionibacter intestinalis]MBV5096789.1 pentapeptide repeat-containing protein [Tenebrionicola larvae]